ncbi:hypothetical protein, partial [Acinetobacter baumannii]|uniref:hypothetical protein n=1 Tax=Acinetobacter baumannii TaxID=470 RepID=UPI0028A152D1
RGAGAAAAAGAPAAPQQFLAGEGELFAGGCVRGAAVLAGVKKAASAAAPANVYRFYPASCS